MDVFHYISKFQKSNREQKGTTALLIQHPKHVTPMGDELVACALKDDSVNHLFNCELNIILPSPYRDVEWIYLHI